ncbi:hypothetical protein KUCAC02_007182, partial [Chaenocephalus aceratus]
ERHALRLNHYVDEPSDKPPADGACRIVTPAWVCSRETCPLDASTTASGELSAELNVRFATVLGAEPKRSVFSPLFSSVLRLRGASSPCTALI